MDADTKKREAGCTCHQEEGDSECIIHDPPTCKRCGCEYTMKWPDTEPTKYCNACAHAVVEAAEARAEKAEGERDALSARLAETEKEWDEDADKLCRMENELAEARAERVMFCALVESLTSERDEARRMLGEVTRERDAYRDAKRLAAWMHIPERSWGSGTIEEWRRLGPAFVVVNFVRRGDGTSEAWGQCPGMSASFRDGDEARAAIDAALISGSWWLEGGPHGAGEAK